MKVKIFLYTFQRELSEAENLTSLEKSLNTWLVSLNLSKEQLLNCNCNSTFNVNPYEVKTFSYQITFLEKITLLND